MTSRLKTFLSNAFHFPMNERAEPERPIVLPKLVVGGALLALAVTIGWLMPTAPDASLWWLAGMVVPGTLGFILVVSAPQLAAERSALQPGTWWHKINLRLMKLLTRKRKWCPHCLDYVPYRALVNEKWQVQPAECLQCFGRVVDRVAAEAKPEETDVAPAAPEKLSVRAAKFLANIEHPFQMQSSGTLLFPVQTDKVRLLCLLIPQEFDTGDRVVVLAQFPFAVTESQYPALIQLINELNARLMFGNIELMTEKEGELQARYSIESIGPMADDLIRFAILRATQAADDCHPLLAQLLDGETGPGESPTAEEAAQPATLH
jgi:hypothetical protein